MKTIRIYLCTLLLGFIVIFASRCGRPYEEVFRSFVFEYTSITYMDVGSEDSNLVIRSHSSTGKYYSWKSVGMEKSIYDSLCVFHNDTNYYKTVKWAWSTGPVPSYRGGQAYANDIVSINVVSGVDFDGQHSEGISLNDVIRFCSVSPYKYIQSGYLATFNWESDRPDNFYFGRNFTAKFDGAVFPVNKKLSEMTVEDYTLALTGFSPRLTFDSKPTLNKEIPLTVTITLNDGRVFTDSITKRF